MAKPPSVMLTTPFRLGHVLVTPDRNLLSSGDTSIRLETKCMGVICALADAGGRVVTREDLRNRVWESGSDTSLARAISIIRKAFGTLGAAPIQTIPRRGYRIEGPIDSVADHEPRAATTSNDPKARESFLLGRALTAQIFGDSIFERAIALFEDAVARDPGFAEAWSMLALTNEQAAAYIQQCDRDALMARAFKAAETARALAPQLAIPLAVSAHHAIFRRDFVTAIRLARQAYDLEPGNGYISMRLGYLFGAVGHLERAIPYLERAVSVAPLQGRNFMMLAAVTLSAGDDRAAEVYARKAADLGFALAYDAWAASAHARGDFALAMERFREGFPALGKHYAPVIPEGDMWELIAAGMYSGNARDRERMVSVVSPIADRFVRSPEGVFMQIFARSGAAEPFFQAFGTRTLPGHGIVLFTLWAQSDAAIAIRQHPDFPAFAERIGLTEAWRVYGRRTSDCLGDNLGHALPTV